MTCPICGKHTLPGAKLCGPCRAALKRARDDSVWELPPGLKRPTGIPSADGPPPRWVLGAERSIGWRGWALVMLAGGLSIAGVLKLASPGHGAEAAEPKARGTTLSGSAAVSAPAPSPAAMLAAGVAKTSTVDTAGAQPPVATPPVHEAAHVSRPHERPAASARAAKAPPAPSSEPMPPSLPAPAAAVAEPLRVAAAPPPAPVRPADPWLPLKDALGRCAGEDLFARIACEHRARTRWCDGHWGEVAQCPGAIANDHGQ